LSIRKKKLLTLFVPVILVLIADQFTKYMVRTNPGLHRVNVIDGWLALNFTKNPGMAMGMDFLSTPVISVVAIVATIAIFAYILYTMKEANLAYLLCMGLILGGALGNITDRIFMATVGGYGGVLDGHVVDFIHFNLTIGDTPVFPYIFNVADIAITTSILVMLVFHKKIMPDPSNKSETGEPDQESDGSEQPEFTKTISSTVDRPAQAESAQKDTKNSAAS